MGLFFGNCQTGYGLETDITSLIYDIPGGGILIHIFTNVNWTISINVNWLTASKLAGSGNDSVTFTAEFNDYGSQREGAVTITGGGMEIVIPVYQAG